MNLEVTRRKKVISVCETQPLTALGLEHLIASTSDLVFGSAHITPSDWRASSDAAQSEILIIDKGLGVKLVLDALTEMQLEAHEGTFRMPSVVVWGMSISEGEALRFLQAGAKGIIRKSADADSILACLRSVAQGRSWMQDSVFRNVIMPDVQIRTDLTPRERQVMQLVEQGYKNREIAQELGIRPGTVKIHLKHIFEKTGVHGRNGLALNGLRQKGIVSLLAS